MASILDEVAGSAKSGLDYIYTVVQNISKLREGDLITATNNTRVTPPAVIDKDITYLDSSVQRALMQTAVSQYVGFYSMAFEQLTLTVNGVSITSILEQLSTERDFVTAYGTEHFHSPELHKGNFEESLEDLLPKTNAKRPVSMSKQFDDSHLTQTSGLEAMSKKDVAEWSNLAVGKSAVLGIQSEKGKTIEFSVLVRALPQIVDKSIFTNVLAAHGKDNTFFGRLHRTRAGELSVLDFLFMLDLIKADKKALIKDKQGIYKAARKRRKNGLLAAIASDKRSLNMASGIMIISKATEQALNVTLRGRISDYKTREKLFTEFAGLILFVVDPQNETLTIYNRGIEGGGIYTFDEIENNKSNPNGVNVNEMIKAYRMGNVGGI